MDGIIAYILSKKYVDDTVIGMGAIKGAPCQVQSIDKVDGVTTITLKWEDNLGDTHTQTFEIDDGVDGISVVSIQVDSNNHLIFELSDGTTIDCGEVAEKSKMLTGTLLASGWSNKSQTVTVSGLDGNENGVIGLANTVTDTEIAAARNSLITVKGISGNQITFKCDQVPNVDINFAVFIAGSGGSSGGGTTVIPNPTGVATDELEKLQIGDEIFSLPEGGDATLESTVIANTTVGAITSGTTLAQGTTFTEFVQKLLISEIAITSSMTMTKTGNVAYGDSYNETLSVTVSNMGTAKTIDKIAWYKGSTLLQEDTIGSSTTGTWTYVVPSAVTDTATFKAVITYTKSNDAQATQEKTTSITFYYNKFRGVVDSLTPSEATVEALTSALATAKGGTYTFTATAQRIAYAYPASLGALTSIKDGNGFSLFDSFTRTTESYTQAGNTVSYYLYVLTDATTVSSYSVTFA